MLSRWQGASRSQGLAGRAARAEPAAPPGTAGAVPAGAAGAVPACAAGAAGAAAAPRPDAASGSRAAASRSTATGTGWTAGRMGSASESTSSFLNTRARAGGFAGARGSAQRARRSGDLRELDADDLAQLVVEAHGGAAVALAADVRDRRDRRLPAGRRQRRGDRDQRRAGHEHRVGGTGE